MCHVIKFNEDFCTKLVVSSLVPRPLTQEKESGLYSYLKASSGLSASYSATKHRPRITLTLYLQMDKSLLQYKVQLYNVVCPQSKFDLQRTL